MYMEKTIIQKDARTPVFTIALFTIYNSQDNLNVHRQMNVVCINIYN